MSGFTGRYLALELESAGYAVYGIGSKPLPIPNYHVADLANPEALEFLINTIEPDVVIHLAAIAYVAHGNAKDFYAINLMGTYNLLQALGKAKKPPRSVLLASSANVYGNSTAGVIIEETPPAPANDYAVSKLAMEHMARLWMDRLPIQIARPFNYTGVGHSSSFLLPKIVDHFRRGVKEIELGNLEVWRDFSDVRSVVAAYRRLIEIERPGNIVNICSGTSYSLKEIIGMMELISGREIDVRVNPAFVRSNEVKQLRGDPTKLKSLIGEWQIHPLEDTLKWMLFEPESRSV